MIELGKYGSIYDGDFIAQMKNIIKDNDRIIISLQQQNVEDERLKEYWVDKSYHPPAKPELVVLPTSAEEISLIVKLCNQYKIPITPRGAGTGLEGGCIAYCGGVILCTSLLKTISLNKEDMYAEVGAGVLKNELNAKLKPEGFLFGPDPASNPSIGGMASTSGSGMSTLKYGTTKENILSLIVVSAQGEIIKTRQNVRKASTGYDVNQLFIGSEGTLGIIVQLVVRIHPLLNFRCGAIVSYHSIYQAASAVVLLTRKNIPTLVRCELLNKNMMKCNNQVYNTQLRELPSLFLEFQSNDTQTSLDQDLFRAIQLLQGLEGYHHSQISKDDNDLDEIWSARRGCYYASKLCRGLPSDHVFISDVCVPVSKLAQCIAETEADFASINFEPLICAHISDGNFHCMIPFQPATEKQTITELEHRLVERAIGFGGSVSGEHGVGIGKRNAILKEHGAPHLLLQIAIKKAMDPNLIMNPMKLFLYTPQSKL